MSVTITDNTAIIKTKAKRGINLALRMTLDDIDREAFRRTPKKKGELRKNLRKSVLGHRGRIEWTSDYAIFQETKQYQNYTTPGTGPHFAENAVKKSVHKFYEHLRRAM